MATMNVDASEFLKERYASIRELSGRYPMRYELSWFRMSRSPVLRKIGICV